jgi:hypothetical protein
MKTYSIVFVRKCLETFLNNVIPVEVLNKCHDVGAHAVDGGANVRRQRQILDEFLNRSSTVHVERNVDQFRSDGVNNDALLLVRGDLDHLLAEVVAEGVWERQRNELRATRCKVTSRRLLTGHELIVVAVDLGKDEFAVTTGSVFEFALEETAAVLVLAQRSNLADESFNLGVHKAG